MMVKTRPISVMDPANTYHAQKMQKRPLFLGAKESILLISENYLEFFCVFRINLSESLAALSENE